MTTIMNDRRWRTIWAGWLIYFGAAEYAALRSKNPKAPLSYFLRYTLGIPHSPMHRRAGQVALGAGIVCLVVHIYEKNIND